MTNESKIEKELNWLKENDVELFKKIRLIVITDQRIQEIINHYSMKSIYKRWQEGKFTDFLKQIEEASFYMNFTPIDELVNKGDVHD
jgi:hypothetical protein